MGTLHGTQVNAYVEDVGRCVDFYSTIGCEETFRTPAQREPIHVEMALDGFTIGLASVASARDDHGLEATAPEASVEIVLWSDDTDADHTRLLGLGATSLSEPHDWLDGRLRVARVADPEGHPIQLVQRTRPA